MNAMRKQLDKQAEQLQKILNDQSQKTQINYNNFNIIINNFGAEDRSHITPDFIRRCLDNMHVTPLIQQVYFDPLHPENHTIKLKSEKKSRVLVHNDGEWIEEDMNARIDNMIQKENNVLCKYFIENVFNDEDISFDKKAFMQGRIVKLNDKDKAFYEQRRSVQVMIKSSDANKI